ncbi:MAG: hypothetical protein ACQSGP_11190, partial [Frankia sp.]
MNRAGAGRYVAVTAAVALATAAGLAAVRSDPAHTLTTTPAAGQTAGAVAQNQAAVITAPDGGGSTSTAPAIAPTTPATAITPTSAATVPVSTPPAAGDPAGAGGPG